MCLEEVVFCGESLGVSEVVGIVVKEFNSTLFEIVNFLYLKIGLF